MDSVAMTSVVSSNISEIGYDQSNQVVYVRFLNGTLYTYKGVPEHEYQGLFNASSIGAYLNRNFKNVYPYERLE